MAIESEEKRKMTREEAGRKGGQKRLESGDLEFFRKIGRKGGEKVAEERGSEFYREIGKKGGESRGSKQKNRNSVSNFSQNVEITS